MLRSKTYEVRKNLPQSVNKDNMLFLNSNLAGGYIASNLRLESPVPIRAPLIADIRRNSQEKQT